MCRSTQQLRVPHPQKYLEFRGHEIASEFLGIKTMFLDGQMTVLHMYKYLSVHCTIYHYSRLSDHWLILQPHLSQIRLVRQIISLEERKVVRRLV